MCSHTPPHFLNLTQHHTSVTVTELLPATEQGCNVLQWLLAHFRPSLEAHECKLFIMISVALKLMKLQDELLFMFKSYDFLIKTNLGLIILT